jgi:lysyl-tRNA synthetase, class I
MQWLNKVVDELIKRKPEGEILVSSGVSPSGAYHVGTLREVLTAEVITRELKLRGRDSKHIHVSDDLDVFRKVPKGLPSSYEKYLGLPLYDVPAPDGSKQGYADYYLSELPKIAKKLRLEMEVMRAHEKYQAGFFVPAIEQALTSIEKIRTVLEKISGRKLDENWSPVQIIEDGYLKNRKFLKIEPAKKQIQYEDKDGKPQSISYMTGKVKLNWRIDWPARWALLGVDAEPFGRDHATKGGSYETGAVIVKDVFDQVAPYPVPYHFINRTGETKKMSKSGGDTITAAQLLDMLPPEIVWYFMLRLPPEKQLFFDEGETLMRLVDEYSELLAKPDKTDAEKQLINLCSYGVAERTVSNIPFSHLVASYQASLKDADMTIDVIKRTEHADVASEQAAVIKNELRFIDKWLEKYAPDDIKFSLADTVNTEQFSGPQKQFMANLAHKIVDAPEDADGEWFHKVIYDLKEESGLQSRELFITLYLVLIAKTSGPRAGWFLSILPRDWLVARLRLES